ncbi:hypothetical protein GCK72_020794 [Caenorhabditis remanei]|uniref:Uncharacterized protein n=1 Tax=Caenorhabditis remanei TaxID=31234 RepID=A0A6A5GHJ1_CAERE|nr:hypothetical protein GCK72_020794 [Caenorhabditis remanei]KAF1754234.1 hypothetical protein GCK72_020794 [Caenorhabditis remanei]
MSRFYILLLILNLIGACAGIQKIECSNYSAPVTVIPPIDGPTQLLLDFRLLSDEQLCNSRRKVPKFKKMHIEPSSYITACDECPQCYFTFPMQFELPISWTIKSLFVISKSQPHHQSATDVPIHYVIVEKMPSGFRVAWHRFQQSTQVTDLLVDLRPDVDFVVEHRVRDILDFAIVELEWSGENRLDTNRRVFREHLGVSSEDTTANHNVDAESVGEINSNTHRASHDTTTTCSSNPVDSVTQRLSDLSFDRHEDLEVYDGPI